MKPNFAFNQWFMPMVPVLPCRNAAKIYSSKTSSLTKRIGGRSHPVGTGSKLRQLTTKWELLTFLAFAYFLAWNASMTVNNSLSSSDIRKSIPKKDIKQAKFMVKDSLHWWTIQAKNKDIKWKNKTVGKFVHESWRKCPCNRVANKLSERRKLRKGLRWCSWIRKRVKKWKFERNSDENKI